ncbi:MAG: hypothetical protein M1381_03800 [Deltaproteobacteria bacterium]|nr:hypothetical protein [Deltaproteobacteria bacterium]
MEDGFDSMVWFKKNHCFQKYVSILNDKICHIGYDGSVIGVIIKDAGTAILSRTNVEIAEPVSNKVMRNLTSVYKVDSQRPREKM